MGNFMGRMSYEEYMGYDILPTIIINTVIGLVICGGSYFLLKRKHFRANVVYLVVVGILLVLPDFLWELPEPFWCNYIFLVFCVWEHYWALNHLGEAPISLEKAWRLQTVVAVVLTVCWLLCFLEVGFFRSLNETTFLVAAGYLWLHRYFHRNDTSEETSAF